MRFSFQTRFQNRKKKEWGKKKIPAKDTLVCQRHPVTRRPCGMLSPGTGGGRPFFFLISGKFYFFSLLERRSWRRKNGAVRIFAPLGTNDDRFSCADVAGHSFFFFFSFFFFSPSPPCVLFLSFCFRWEIASLKKKLEQTLRKIILPRKSINVIRSLVQ